MKYRKWMTVGAALAFLFTAQPAYAAPVIVAGSGSLAAESMQTVGEQQAPEAVTQAPGAGQTETTAAVSQSPTIVSGQGQSAPGSCTGGSAGCCTAEYRAESAHRRH